jgi:hypothetical protein
LVLTLTTRALADPVPQVSTTPAGDDRIVVVREGDRVPFTGQLFDGPTALRWANWLEQYRQLLPTTHQHDEQVCQIKLNYDAKVLTVEQQRAKAVEQDLKQRLAGSEKQRAAAEYEAQNPAWYRTVWFGAGVGVVATIAIAAVVVRTR